DELDRVARAPPGVPKHETGLHRAVVDVALETEARVDGRPELDAEPPLTPKRHRPGAGAARADREPRVAPLPHRPQVLEPRAGDEEARSRIAHPARLEPDELLGEGEPELRARDDRIDPLARREQVVGEHGVSAGFEALAEGADA